MADKQISQLVAATTINNDDLFVMQQGGTAKKLSGQKLADFVYQSAADQIERVNEAVEQTQAAVDALEEQKNEIAQTIADMAELGTDTTLTTPGMAADAAATGVVKDTALARFEQSEITGVPIATFDDGADNVPVKKLVVNIEPVQDLHGQANPYPAGGGKNLFDKDHPNVVNGYITESIFNSGNDKSKTIYIAISPSTTYTVSKKAGARFRIATAATIPENNAPLTYFVSNNTATSLTITSGESDAYLWAFVFLKDTDTGTLDQMLETVQIEVGSTATSYAPYSNICPITGWTVANVTRTGKNLANIVQANEAKLNGGSQFTLAYSSDNTVTMQTSSVGAYYVVYEIFGIITSSLVGKQVTVSGIGLDTYDRFVKADSWSGAITDTNTTSYTFQQSDIGKKFGFRLYNSSGSNKTLKNIQVEFASSATTFEPYQGYIYNIEFPSEAGTVYGGTLDVTNGELISNWISVTVNGSGYGVFNYGSHRGDTACLAAVGYPRGIIRGIPPICDSLPTGASTDGTFNHVSAFNSGDVLQFVLLNSTTGLTSESTREEINAAFNAYFAEHPAQVVYQIKTDTEYQIDPVEVKTLLGYNNIWADTSNINDLIYRKMPIAAEDLENTIESMIAGVEVTMEATQNYTAGKLVIAAHKLYYIDSNIASGETLVPGTNCHVTIVADELANLAFTMDIGFSSLGNLANLTYEVVT